MPRIIRYFFLLLCPAILGCGPGAEEDAPLAQSLEPDTTGVAQLTEEHYQVSDIDAAREVLQAIARAPWAHHVQQGEQHYGHLATLRLLFQTSLDSAQWVAPMIDTNWTLTMLSDRELRAQTKPVKATALDTTSTGAVSDPTVAEVVPNGPRKAAFVIVCTAANTRGRHSMARAFQILGQRLLAFVEFVVRNLHWVLLIVLILRYARRWYKRDQLAMEKEEKDRAKRRTERNQKEEKEREEIKKYRRGRVSIRDEQWEKDYALRAAHAGHKEAGPQPEKPASAKARPANRGGG